VKPVIDQRWKDHVLENPADKGKKPRLKFRNDIVKELWDAESAAVRAEVEARREEGFSDDEMTDEDDDGVEGGEDLDVEEGRRRAKACAYQR